MFFLNIFTPVMVHIFYGLYVAENRVNNIEQKAIIAAFQDAWSAYRQYAWGHDEFHPITKKSSEWFGVGLTILDSMDTAIIMGLKKGSYLFFLLLFSTYLSLGVVKGSNIIKFNYKTIFKDF